MGGTIPRIIKEKVLNLWLQGKVRAKIANEVGIGDGAVTTIVNESSKIETIMT